MSCRLIFRKEAEEDISAAAIWYEKREPGLGFELLIEVNRAAKRALENPKLFLSLRHEPEVRRVLVRRFPYRLFFIRRTDAIVVFAVLHAARHDRQWKGRV